jgi:hypothetical protein
MMGEIVYANRVPGVEGSPECSEDFESHSSSAIAGCPYHDRRSFIVDRCLCKPTATNLLRVP